MASLKFAILFVLPISVLPIEGKIAKRQLFREQVLPTSGGKVPESAFWNERLALNQLNAHGIYSSTGSHLEHSRNLLHQQTHSRRPYAVQVPAPPEDRFVGAPGRVHYKSPQMLSTTYVIRDPVAAPLGANLLHQAAPLIPYTSLKLARYYNQRRNKDVVANDFSTQARKEYEPYLKKLHEVD